MPVTIIAKIKPLNNGSFPVVEDVDIEGGFRTVADATARDAIPSLRRKEGMHVYLTGTNQTYRLGPSLMNADWQLVSSSSSSVGVFFNCSMAENIGDAVYISGDDNVRQARSDSSLTMPVVGVIFDKPSATTCWVTSAGQVDGYAGLVAGTRYYLSDTVAGALTDTPGNVPGDIIQKVGIGKSGSSLFIQIDMPIVVS